MNKNLNNSIFHIFVFLLQQNAQYTNEPAYDTLVIVIKYHVKNSHSTCEFIINLHINSILFRILYW